MADIRTLFAGGSLSCDEFMEKLSEAGFVILQGKAEDYIPASRESEFGEKLQSARAEFEEKLTKERAVGALKLELVKLGAMNPALAASVIGCDGICGSDDEIKLAAESKVKFLKQTEPYMFASVAEESFSTGSMHSALMLDTESMSDSEYYSYKKMM